MIVFNYINMQKKYLIGLTIAGAIVFFIAAFFSSIVNLIVDWFWFDEVGFTQIFTTILKAKVFLGFVFGLVVFILTYLNLRLASFVTRSQPEIKFSEMPQLDLKKYFNWLILVFCLVVGVLAGLYGVEAWEVFLKFFNKVPFGVKDPVFSRDISYYFFSLPLIKALLGLGFSMVIVSLLGSGVIYFLRGSLTFLKKIFKTAVVLEKSSDKVNQFAKGHLLVLISLLFILQGLQIYFVRIPELLYSQTGSFLGANYTDINIVLPFLKILGATALVAAALSLINIFKEKYRLFLGAIGLYIIVAMVGGLLLPGIVQKFIVIPNELVKEEPFIENNIEATRHAFNLNNIEEKNLDAEAKLSMKDINNNEATVKNVRLWDRQPLLDTFGQLQEIRTYYDFVSVDNDRYNINNELRQVMLSPRELNTASLPHRTFINKRFTFTHGFGLTLGPVNEATREGLPQLFIKDLPPESSIKSLKVERPEIYYGELSSNYVFVKAKSEEFDYPKGEENVYNEYQGNGGVVIDSLFKKALFAVKFASLKIFMSSDIESDSRIMYYRKINERVKKAFPFLKFDADPYLVVAKDGRLKWIYDAYTTSSAYPYAEKMRGADNEQINYIRNSAKIVIDAYSGKMQAYLADNQDPLILTYAKMFPDVFESLDSMPSDLKKHIRYPEDLFAYQTKMYSIYHMDKSQIFYNKEDQWDIPKVMSKDESDLGMRHIIMKLPSEKKEEFILMIPYTPKGKDNMAAWMVARSDGDNYGKLLVYRFPKQKLVYGPKQIINRINQDPEISRQISLWDQRGSEVNQGNLMVIPIEQSLLYVRPLYICSEGGKIPELKRVIVAYEDSIAMEESLGLALQRIFKGEARVKVDKKVGGKKEVSQDFSEQLKKAEEYYRNAIEAQKRGDWKMYGEEIEKLGNALK